MLRKSFKAGAAVIGGTMLAATILTGCAGGPKVTLDGSEVSNLDKAIESADNLWAQNRASGTASNVDKESRCYAQASNGVLAKQALCGPIHYLGSDDQVWETMDWQPAGDGKDKVQLTAGNSFSEGEKAPNAELFRPDGKKVPDGLQVPEPDTKSATATQAIWGSSSSSSSSKDDKNTTLVQTPDATISVTHWKISDRVGGESDRVKAGDGNKFVSVDLSMNSVSSGSSLTDLAFISGGKTYPAGKAKNGSLAMAVPGDGKDAVLAVTYDGLTQKVSLGDGKLDSKATAYYAGFSDSASSPSLEPFRVGNQDSGTSTKFQPKGFTANLTAYEPKAGWAPEGKAWLVVKGEPDHDGFQDRNSEGSVSYSAPTKISAATVKNVSGTAFSADAKRIDNTVDSGFFGSTTQSTVVFEVPAGVGDFSVALTLNVSGAMDSSSSQKTHPSIASLDGTIPPFELTFTKTK
jgi:hypothetical protein